MAGRTAPDALDAELTHRIEEQDRIAAALLDLERHTGHRLLAGAALVGVTAARWAATQDVLATLWTDLAAHRAVVADACAVRTRRPRPGEREWAELHELLLARSVGAAPTPDVLIAQTDTRIREVAGVLNAAETVHLAALAGLGPLAERVRDAQARTRELLEPGDPDVAALAGLAAAIDTRLATCTHDPLSLPAQLPHDLVAGLDEGLDAIEARLRDRAAIRDAWSDRRRAVADAVAALDPLYADEARARREALDHVAGADPPPPADHRRDLHRRLADLPAHRPAAAALTALSRLAADVDAAADAARAALEHATGLTDRRAELAGRFAAYRAKALRVGVSDDPEVTALAAQVRELLAVPADLPALTPALVAYQQRVNDAAMERSPR